MKPQTSACKKCGAAIYWAKIEGGKHAGKNWPFDEHPSVNGDYRLIMDSSGGNVRAKWVPKETRTALIADNHDRPCLRTAHFTTCEEKEESRPRGGNPPPEIDPDTIPF